MAAPAGPDSPATARDRHLFGPGPKRILALDGGGVRGAIAVAFVEAIERALCSRAGRPVRICDYFDLIGGTSTGAIIAGALALGYRAAQIREFYTRLAPRAFRRPLWRVPLLSAKFDARHLRREIDAVIGDRRLDSPDLLTGLAVVMKRMDTGSPWIVSNNPRARYWETPADGSYIGNRHYPLGNLVRASTAAPSYFDPEPLAIVDGMPPGLFVDGGVTPHHNPSLQLFMMAAMKGYGLDWPTGPDKLMIVSVGTGTHRRRLPIEEAMHLTAAGLALRAAVGLMADNEELVATLLHWLGGSPSRWPINSEIGTLEGAKPPGSEPALTFRRYNVRLEADWLASELGVALSADEVAQLTFMDDPRNAIRLYEIGRLAADRLVGADDFPRAFDP